MREALWFDDVFQGLKSYVQHLSVMKTVSWGKRYHVPENVFALSNY